MLVKKYVVVRKIEKVVVASASGVTTLWRYTNMFIIIIIIIVIASVAVGGCRKQSCRAYSSAL